MRHKKKSFKPTVWNHDDIGRRLCILWAVGDGGDSFVHLLERWCCWYHDMNLVWTGDGGPGTALGFLENQCRMGFLLSFLTKCCREQSQTRVRIPNLSGLRAGGLDVVIGLFLCILFLTVDRGPRPLLIRPCFICISVSSFTDRRPVDDGRFFHWPPVLVLTDWT